MRENRTYGSEGGEAKAFPTPINVGGYGRPLRPEGRRAPVTSRGAASTRLGDVPAEGRGLRLPAGLNRGAIFESVFSLFKGLWRLFRFCGRKFWWKG